MNSKDIENTSKEESPEEDLDKKKLGDHLHKSLLYKYKHGLVDFDEIVTAIDTRKQCYRSIKGQNTFANISNKQAYVVKTCAYVTDDCLECKNKLALKIYRPGTASTQEANIIQQLSNGLKKDSVYGPTYSRHILEYVDFLEGQDKNPDILVTKLVEYSPNRVINLKEFLISGHCSTMVLDSLLIQIFLTLQYATHIVENFVHFDLLAQQIFLRKTKKQIRMKTNSLTFLLPTGIEAVIGDFGYSLSKEFPNENTLKHFKLRNSGFDIYRLLDDCRDHVEFHDNLRNRIDFWIRKVFSGKKSLIDSLAQDFLEKHRAKNKNFKTYRYLPLEASKYLQGSPEVFLRRMLPYLSEYYYKVQKIKTKSK